MTHSDLKIWPDVVVSVHSAHWIAAVQRAAYSSSQIQLNWQASIEDAFSSASQSQGSAVILEWPKTADADSLAIQLAHQTNNPQCSLVFILADQRRESVREAFLRNVAAGFATSIVDFDLIWSRVIRHLRNHEIGGLSVEEFVETRFPFF